MRNRTHDITSKLLPYDVLCVSECVNSHSLWHKHRHIVLLFRFRSFVIYPKEKIFCRCLGDRYNGSPYAMGPSSVLSVCNVGVLCQMVGCIKMPLGTQVSLGPGDVMLDGYPAPPRGKGHSKPHFSAHVYCGQTVAHLSN